MPHQTYSPALGPTKGLGSTGLGFRLYWGYTGILKGLYRDNGKEIGNYCVGFLSFGIRAWDCIGILSP